MATPSLASSPTNLTSLALLTLLSVALLSHTCHLPTTAKALRVVKKMGEGDRTLPPNGRLGGDNGPREGPGTGNSPRLDSPPGSSQYTVTSRNNDGSYSYATYNTPGGGQDASGTSNCAVVYNCPRQYETPGYTVTRTNYDAAYSYSYPYVGYNTFGGDPYATDTSGCTVVSSCSPP